MWMPLIKSGALNPNSETFVVYDISKSIIAISDQAQLEEDIKAGLVDKYSLVRDLSMTSPSICIKDHELFADLFLESK